MSSHWKWAEVVCAEHAANKPFAPENGEPLKFQIGDPVIFTNDYGVTFPQRVTGLYPPDSKCSLYATGYRYLLDTASYWMPVKESSLQLDATRPKSFLPTEEQTRAAENLFAIMAHESMIRPIVEKYEADILQRLQFRISRHWVELGCEDTLVLARKEAFLLSKEDSAVFHAECLAARDAANLKVERPDNCPLLEVEYLRMQAESALIKAISTIPGFERLGTGIMTLDQHKLAIDISMKLCAPSCGTSDEILQRLVGTPPSCSCTAVATT